jgi:hypothetical protein
MGIVAIYLLTFLHFTGLTLSRKTVREKMKTKPQWRNNGDCHTHFPESIVEILGFLKSYNTDTASPFWGV